jgi:hypothetical protein
MYGKLETIVFIQALEIEAIVRLHGYRDFTECVAVTTTWLFDNKWNWWSLLWLRRDEWLEPIQASFMEELGGSKTTQNSNAS